MQHYLRILMAASALSLSLPAFAQQRPQICSEGKTMTGQCANVLTSRFGRSNAILYSQARISYSAPLTRPRDDGMASAGSFSNGSARTTSASASSAARNGGAQLYSCRYQYERRQNTLPSNVYELPQTNLPAATLFVEFFQRRPVPVPRRSGSFQGSITCLLLMSFWVALLVFVNKFVCLLAICSLGLAKGF